MLAPLIDDKQKISLIENSGVQFLDFGLQLSDTPARASLCARPPTARCCA